MSKLTEATVLVLAALVLAYSVHTLVALAVALVLVMLSHRLVRQARLSSRKQRKARKQAAARRSAQQSRKLAGLN